jgi:phosphatidylinositol glycan class U
LLQGIFATFKAYPTLSDPGLFLSMFSIFPEVYPCKQNFNVLYPKPIYVCIDLKNPIVTTLLHLHASLLLPLFHRLWLSQGTGNANFFYASTLVFGLANGFAVLDAIWAGLRIAFGPVEDKVEIAQK